MTFTNKNKFFEYTVTLDISKNVFHAQLAKNKNIFAVGSTIEEAVHNLEELV